MRSKNGTTVLYAMQAAGIAGMYPCVDGNLISQSAGTAIRLGNFNTRAAMLVGHNYAEGNMFAEFGAFIVTGIWPNPPLYITAEQVCVAHFPASYSLRA